MKNQLITFLFLFPTLLSSQTLVTGSLPGNTIWTVAGSPYWIYINNAPGCNSVSEILSEGPIVPPIPTMNEWALFLFALLIVTLGIITLYNFTRSNAFVR
jgi:hypothetical protein